MLLEASDCNLRSGIKSFELSVMEEILVSKTILSKIWVYSLRSWSDRRRLSGYPLVSWRERPQRVENEVKALIVLGGPVRVQDEASLLFLGNVIIA
jgi:hypothetical protein